MSRKCWFYYLFWIITIGPILIFSINSALPEFTMQRCRQNFGLLWWLTAKFESENRIWFYGISWVNEKQRIWKLRSAHLTHQWQQIKQDFFSHSCMVFLELFILETEINKENTIDCLHQSCCIQSILCFIWSVYCMREMLDNFPVAKSSFVRKITPKTTIIGMYF